MKQKQLINIGLKPNKTHLGDLMVLMKKINTGTIDMVFIDPPYNLKKNYSIYNDELRNSDYVGWCNNWLSECMRVLKSTGSLFVINIPKWLTYHACHLNKIGIFRHWIAWNALGSPTNSKLLPAHYGILWYTKTMNSKTYPVRIPHQRDKDKRLIADWGGKKELLHPYGKIASDIWIDIHRIRHKVRRDAHPCQLPPHLIERMILSTTDENDVVLDPMMGTGTTAVASKRMGRNYIGIELDEKYVKIAEENAKDSKPKKINEVFVSIYLNKVISVRENDYKKVESYLEPIDQKINGSKYKTMRLPTLIKK